MDGRRYNQAVEPNMSGDREQRAMTMAAKTTPALIVALSLAAAAWADEPRATGAVGNALCGVPGAGQVTRIGAVAYSPAAVTIFQGLTRYLSQRGLPSDYVLYSNYDALVAALAKGEIDIAWNTPLAHAKFHVQNQCASQTLVMRDVDVGVRSVLVARSDARIASLSDLAGKRLVLGSSQAAEATVLPLYYLKKSGVDFSRIKIVSLDAEVDSKGNPCASPQHVLAALANGRGDAGVITADLWGRVKDEPGRPSLQAVWTSPPFSHCVFTAAARFDKDRATRFTKLMQAMDPSDSETQEVMRLEGTRQWLAGSADGFRDLIEALAAK
jgi:ABC-type phosphate/phosphonate transport system substrate-binding protein